MAADGETRRVLAVHSGALGDVILFAHLLTAVGGKTTLVTGGEKGRLLKELGVVDEVLDFDALPMEEIFTDTPLGQCRLPKLLGMHDRLISCFASGDTVAQQRFAALSGTGDAAFLPIRPPEGSDAHLLALWADLLGTAVPTSFDPWRVPDVPVDRDKWSVLIHPGAGSADKCWPLSRFLDMAEVLAGPPTFRTKVRFVLGPVEFERWSWMIRNELRRFQVVSGVDLMSLAGLSARAASFVGNDSGPAHLAAALGIPTVVLFGPTSARHFAPVGAGPVTVLEDMMNITPTDVIEKLAPYLPPG